VATTRWNGVRCNQLCAQSHVNCALVVWTMVHIGVVVPEAIGSTAFSLLIPKNLTKKVKLVTFNTYIVQACIKST